MFSIIGSGLELFTDKQGKLKPRGRGLKVACHFIDFAGGVTAIVLGALALTNHGGSVVARLNDVSGGGWGTMAGGIIALGALHLQRESDNKMMYLASKTESFNARNSSQEGTLKFGRQFGSSK